MIKCNKYSNVLVVQGFLRSLIMDIQNSRTFKKSLPKKINMQPESSFMHDMGFFDLTFNELILQAEQLLGVSFDNEINFQRATIGSLAEIILNKLNEEEGEAC